MSISTKYIVLQLAGCLLMASSLFGQQRAYYQEPKWQPRAILPYNDAINNDFWPASPKVNTNYDDPEFDLDRLSKVPGVGVHPRVLLTPSDVDRVREKVALGDKAPLPFKTMWKRVERSQSAFYALVTKNDQLGKQLAAQLVAKLHSLEPKIDSIDKQPDRDNIWAVERSTIASGTPDPPTEIYELLDYDYLADWMSTADKELARRVIARLINHRVSNFLSVPDHFMNNNHEGFGMEYIRLMLLIEGEPGFDKNLFNACCRKVRAMLNWYLDDDGMCYESIKGWLNISAFTAAGLRDREILLNSHLRAKMNFFAAAIRWEDGAWHIRDEMRASAFHVIWMMHYYHPNDKKLDFLYQATLSTHPFLTDPDVRWPDPVGICNELLLLYANDGMKDKEGKPFDWNDQNLVNSLNLPLLWHDDNRGYVDVRNSWGKDDLHVGFVCKQDFFYGGHEGSENNRLTLWKDGVNWVQDNNMLATKATFLQNMVTVDGKGCHWPPAPGTWLGINQSSDGVIAAGDGKDGFTYTKSMQIHPLAFPSAKLGYYAPFTEGNFDLSRDLQVAFNPRTVAWNDGYAHTDYGPWSGETCLVENYRVFNPVEKAYRTVMVAKGEHPYVLVVDDIKKDNDLHQYEMNLSVPLDAELVSVATPEVVFQNTEPSAIRMDDLILGKKSMDRDAATGKLKPKKGDPLCLIRVLWRNADYGFPVPHLQQLEGYNLVTIPSRSVSPDFRVLIYPYKFGEDLPLTTWNQDMTQLQVKFKGQTDNYTFEQADGGRTVLTQNRNGNQVLSSNVQPARPQLLVRGDLFDANTLRYTQMENKVPVYLVNKSLEVQFTRVQLPAEIRYTLDGSEPNAQSPLYSKPIVVDKSAQLKAIVYDPSWAAGEKASKVLTAQFIAKVAEPAVMLPQVTKSGLLVRVYEQSTKLYNDKGFFDKNKVMMPDLEQAKPTLATAIPNFALPIVTPTKAMEQQCKGFYRFNGYFYAAQDGVYQFDVNSCGPVTLDIGSQVAIEATSLFHEQQAHRTGEVSLAKGWHPLQLVICDPLFWNINSLDNMPFEVSYRLDGGLKQSVGTDLLKFQQPQQVNITDQPDVKWLKPVVKTTLVEAGFDLRLYDRTGKRRDHDFMDIADAVPFHTERSSRLEATDGRNVVRVYDGYLHITESGVYLFKMPARSGDNAGLGANQASCQSQLRIADTVVLQRGIYGRNLDGRIGLHEGWYPISIRLGIGVPLVEMQYPSGQSVKLNADDIFRDKVASVIIDSNVASQNLVEIYHPVAVQFQLVGYPKAEIRYTTDGSSPNLKSTLYTAPLKVVGSQTLMMEAFLNGVAITAPQTLTLRKVDEPQQGILGKVSFAEWNGRPGNYPVNAKYQVWVSDFSKLSDLGAAKVLSVSADGNDFRLKPSVDVNVSRGANSAAFKLHHIQCSDNALTVGMWFKTKDVSGKLFGKEGYNAFGKSYKTISCTFDHGRLITGPVRLTGGKIEPDTWQYVVLTANEQKMAVYLNGKLIASDVGTKSISTDALDFLTDTNASVGEFQLYNKLLTIEEVQQLYNHSKGQYNR